MSVDHLANSNTKFRGLMDWIRKSQHSFTKEGLMHSQIDGFNSWEIALELGTFTWKWLHSDIKDLRQTLCGHAEDLSGFELWKNLETKYGGTGKEVEVSGLGGFLSFRSCHSNKGFSNTLPFGRSRSINMEASSDNLRSH